MTGKAEFVVVANRLPVDLERAPDGSENWKRSPGGLVTALEPVLRTPPRSLGGLAGPARRRRGAVRGRRPPAAPGDACRPRTSRTTTRASPTTRSGRSTTTSSLRRRTTGTGGRPTCKVNERFAAAVDGGRRRGRDGLGAGLPAAAGARAMLRDQRPDLRIGFFLHIPFPPVELFLQLPVARADRARAARRRPRRLPHAGRRTQLPQAGHAAGRGDRRRATEASPSASRTVKLGAFPISIDYAALDELSRTPEVIARAAEIRHELGDPRQAAAGRRPPRLHQGHRRPAARLRGTARRGAGLGRRHGVPADRDAEPGAGGALHPAARRDRADGGTDQRRPRPDRPSSRCTTCTSRCPATS